MLDGGLLVNMFDSYGDGWCDDGAYDLYLDCAEFNLMTGAAL